MIPIQSSRANLGTGTHTVGPGGRYSAIADALAVATTGQIVHVLPGEYDIDTSLIVPEGVSLVGQGENTCRIVSDANIRMVSVSGSNLVQGLRIYNSKTSDQPQAIGPYGSGAVEDVVIRDCNLYSWFDCVMGSSAVGTVGWLIERCRLAQGFDSINAAYGIRLVVRNCLFDATPSYNPGTTYGIPGCIVASGCPLVILQNNVFNVASGGGATKLGCVRFTGSTALKLISSGNVYRMRDAIAAGIYVFAADGSGEVTSGANFTIDSIGDVFDVVGTGVNAVVRWNGKAGNTVRIYGANTVSTTGTKGPSTLSVLPGILHHDDLAATPTWGRHVTEEITDVAGVKAALQDIGVLHARATANVTSADNTLVFPQHTQSVSRAQWISFLSGAIRVVFDKPVYGITADMMTVAFSDPQASVPTAVTGSGAGPYVFTGHTLPDGDGTSYAITLTDAAGDDAAGFANVSPGSWTFTLTA